MNNIFKLIILIALLMSETNELPAQDWGNLNKYAVANHKLGTPTENEYRIIFFGNSITESWAEMRPDFFKDSLHHICRGISGQTTPQMLVRFRGLRGREWSSICRLLFRNGG